MSFYFTIHTLMGLILGSASWLHMQGQKSVFSVPIWVHKQGPYFQLGVAGACLLAIITTFFKFGFFWSLATAAEILFGMALSSLIPMKIRAIAVISSCITVPVMLGALWGFWRLDW